MSVSSTSAGPLSGLSPIHGDDPGAEEVVAGTQPLLPPERVASALSISRAHVFALMRTGQLPFVRVGRFYRVAADDLREFVAARRTVPSAPDQPLRVRARLSR